MGESNDFLKQLSDLQQIENLTGPCQLKITKKRNMRGRTNHQCQIITVIVRLVGFTCLLYYGTLANAFDGTLNYKSMVVSHLLMDMHVMLRCSHANISLFHILPTVWLVLALRNLGWICC